MKTYSWSSLNDSKEISFISPTIVAVRPKSLPDNTPIFCPTCSWSMSSIDDFVSFNDYKCCSWCELTFARKAPTKEDWLMGVGKPTPEILTKSLKERQLLSFSIR